MKSQKKPPKKPGTKHSILEGSSKKMVLCTHKLRETLSKVMKPEKKRKSLSFKAKLKSQKNFSPLFLYLFQENRQKKTRRIYQNRILTGKSKHLSILD